MSEAHELLLFSTSQCTEYVHKMVVFKANFFDVYSVKLQVQFSSSIATCRFLCLAIPLFLRLNACLVSPMPSRLHAQRGALGAVSQTA